MRFLGRRDNFKNSQNSITSDRPIELIWGTITFKNEPPKDTCEKIYKAFTHAHSSIYHFTIQDFSGQENVDYTYTYDYLAMVDPIELEDIFTLLIRSCIDHSIGPTETFFIYSPVSYTTLHQYVHKDYVMPVSFGDYRKALIKDQHFRDLDKENEKFDKQLRREQIKQDLADLKNR